MTLTEQSARYDLTRVLARVVDTFGERARGVVLAALAEVAPAIGEDSLQLIAERNEAQHLAACRDEELSRVEDRIDALRQERDEALREIKGWEDRDDTALAERDEARAVAQELLTRYAGLVSNPKTALKEWRRKHPWIAPPEPAE